MNKKTILLVLGTLAFASCGHDFVYNDGALVDANAERIFGIIDPNHDWNSIASGSITVTADADMSDIVKVQILTESPFGNDEARVLNEVKVNKGDRVTLLYDAPNYYDELIAACVDSKGEYYVKVFIQIVKSAIDMKYALYVLIEHLLERHVMNRVKDVQEMDSVI